jgi:hypothetical protein
MQVFRIQLVCIGQFTRDLTLCHPMAQSPMLRKEAVLNPRLPWTWDQSAAKR